MEPLNSVTSNSIAKADNTNKKQSKEFLSLGQLAAAKIKEKTMDDDEVAMEKKSGRLKKLTGWDIAQIVAKGVSKVTGKKVEAKPTYNDEGEVTAFALGAGGFQISRGK
jgi:exosome complex RNA-binding protein Rrp4